MAKAFCPVTYAKSVLRRQSYKTKAYRAAKKAASRKFYPLKMDGTPSKAHRVEYQCNHCKNWFSSKEIQVDHIVPVERAVDLEGFVLNLFCPESGLQVLCKEHHQEKTTVDNKETKEWKLEQRRKRVARKIGRVIHAGFVDGVWYLLFRNKEEAEQYCEDNNLDYEDLDKLDNGLWRLETDLRVRTGEDEL